MTLLMSWKELVLFRRSQKITFSGGKVDSSFSEHNPMFKLACSTFSLCFPQTPELKQQTKAAGFLRVVFNVFF